jgi:[ribosomal protein S18]-alanine N-acetyltransferase
VGVVCCDFKPLRLRWAYNRGVPVTIRSYEPREFAALHKLDVACFPPGISYSKMMLRYFLQLPAAECLVAGEESRIAGFILTKENPPLGHIVTLDVAESHRRRGVGSLLLNESERNLAFRGVRTILLETAIDNAAAIAFWQRHGYRIEATLQRYYLGRLDAYEMRKKLSSGATGNPAQKDT